MDLKNITSDTDLIYMHAAMEEARLAADRDEVPIGAVLVDIKTGKIVARHGNRTIEKSDPTAHAEILCIRETCQKTGAQRIPDYDLYVTLEPCTLCAAAIAFARLRRLVYAAPDPKGGGVAHGAKFFDQSTCHHKIEIIGGVLADEGGKILKDYFQGKRS
ncbi:MAG TPA: nucleoside deaminase [Alphaproteobacteria bacterium]|nr:nucleoside deaminase [Alphaproteobacteria bacterium]